MWRHSGFTPLQPLLPFVSETLQPVEAPQPAEEGTQAALKVVRLLVGFIVRLLQEQPGG